MSQLAADLDVRQRYLHDHVADRLRALITSGELAPRSRVHELELATRFGISRTPMREAIKILATEGLLELLPNKGARVAHLSIDEIEETLAVIAGLEATAGELACQRISDAELVAIEHDHVAMIAAWREGDEATYHARNRAIHEAIMAAARNMVLATVYASLSGRVTRARYSARKTPEQWNKAIAEHEQMLALIKQRNGPALAQLMRTHIHGKRAIIEAAYGVAEAELSAKAKRPKNSVLKGPGNERRGA